MTQKKEIYLFLLNDEYFYEMKFKGVVLLSVYHASF